MTTIEIEHATAEALAPFGTIIGTDPSIPKLPITFYDGHVEVRQPGTFQSEAPPQLTVCRVKPRPLVIDYMERHPKHTQSFLPLGGKPFIAVFAPPSESMPQPDALRAFYFDGSSGFMMKRDGWHEFPYAVDEDMDLVVLLSSETNANLQEDPNGLGEATGPDLDKRNYKSRIGNIRLHLKA
ncbi:MAG: ureidoglycolate lyase [Sphingomonadales bacterium]